VFAAPAQYVDGLPAPDRCLVMGVLNVTPDSFSDGGSWQSRVAAVNHGRLLLKEGADIVDVGGESTRPGARRPSVEEELARALPVITELAGEGAVLSIDTMRAEVARAAVEAGVRLVNDVSGGLADPHMLRTVAELGVAYLCMHWRGHSTDMQKRATYADVVTDVKNELANRIEAAHVAGVRPGRLAVDPGLGFAKTPEHNWEVLASLESFHELGHPIAVGASRKAFLGALLSDPDGEPRPAGDRDDATAAVSALCAAAGVWCVRVHEVTGSLDAVQVAARWARGGRR
jgi:dihydropteroate synthase